MKTLGLDVKEWMDLALFNICEFARENKLCKGYKSKMLDVKEARVNLYEMFFNVVRVDV